MKNRGQDMFNKIYTLECLNGMGWLGDNSVDLVFTSVPFKNEDANVKTDSEYWDLYSKWHKEMLRVAKNAVIVIQSPSRMNEQIKRFEPKRTMIWGKGVIMNHSRYNPIFVYQLTDDYKINKYIWSDTFGVDPVASYKRCGIEKVHKYQDPVLLYETVLKMFKDCKTVLDPFMGSGTTAIACKNLNLSYIGFEIDRNYVELANKRLEGA
jgi:DNA modification methylase